VTDIAERKRPAALGFGQETAKRVLDFSLSLTLILILLPLLLLLWALVRTTSSGSGVFRQERLGQGSRPFTMLKLRTMRVNCDDRVHRNYVTKLLSDEEPAATEQNGLFKLCSDPRVTRIGALLRRTSLDELPQLFNVLRGDMSLVGPRPVLAWEAELFGEEFQRRFDVKPGITGLWQVSGRSKLTMREALELDVEYSLRRTFMLDVMIILRTLPAMLNGGAR
jgi:lipopolysaccharide/colanic/teichoic acid biosynthesis glycosyltransferase